MEKEIGEIKEGILDPSIAVNQVADVLADKWDQVSPDAGNDQHLGVVELLGVEGVLAQLPGDYF